MPRLPYRHSFARRARVVARLATLLALAVLMLCPSASAQCVPNATVVGAAGINVTRGRAVALSATLAFLAGCAGDPGAGSQMGPGIDSCSFMATPPNVTIMLTAPSQNVPTQSCQWTCGTQTCRVLAGTALPVELMDFSVEAVDDAGGARVGEPSVVTDRGAE